MSSEEEEQCDVWKLPSTAVATFNTRWYVMTSSDFVDMEPLALLSKDILFSIDVKKIKKRVFYERNKERWIENVVEKLTKLFKPNVKILQ